MSIECTISLTAEEIKHIISTYGQKPKPKDMDIRIASKLQYILENLLEEEKDE